MASRAQLAIDIVADGSDAAAAADTVSTSYADMGKSVDRASRMADDGADRLSNAADASDNLASKSSQATGGLGALAAGFELVGLGPYAAGLESAAMATDFFSGVGDIANLVLESQAVQTIKNTALKIKDAVVSRAQAVATGAMTAAQWALNAAMSANPIALIIIALVALTAAVVIAYKKSETFRRIVDAAFRAVRAVVSSVVDAVVGTVTRLTDRVVALFGRLKAGTIDRAQAVLSWVKGHWPLLLAIITGPIGLAVYAIAKRWDDIKAGAQRAWEVVKNTIGNALQRIVDGVQRLVETVRGKVDNVLGFFRDLPDRILRAVGDLGRLLYDTGKDIMQGLLDGITSMVGKLGDKIGDIGGSIKDGIGGALHIGSPSKDMRQLGVWAIEGLVLGLEDQQRAVQAAVAGIASDITGGIQQTTADPIDVQLHGDPSSQLAGRGGVTIIIQGAVDPVSTARQVRGILTRQDTWNGRLVGVTG